MDFFQAIYEWFTVDVYDFVVETMKWLTYKLIWMRIKFMIWLYAFAWDVAFIFLQELDLGARLSSVIGFLPATLKAQLEFFNVFTGLGWLMQSFTTKFVLNFTSKT